MVDRLIAADLVDRRENARSSRSRDRPDGRGPQVFAGPETKGGDRADRPRDARRRGASSSVRWSRSLVPRTSLRSWRRPRAGSAEYVTWPCGRWRPVIDGCRDSLPTIPSPAPGTSLVRCLARRGRESDPSRTPPARMPPPKRLHGCECTHICRLGAFRWRCLRRHISRLCLAGDSKSSGSRGLRFAVNRHELSNFAQHQRNFLLMASVPAAGHPGCRRRAAACLLVALGRAMGEGRGWSAGKSGRHACTHRVWAVADVLGGLRCDRRCW